MLRFDARDPFPHLKHGEVSYAEEQAHAFAADAWLGLNVSAVERDLLARGCRMRAPDASGETQELWLGLAASSLLTPYTEIRRLLDAVGVRSGMAVADLGAAYGRMGFVIARYFAGSRFIGYEYSGERVREGNRVFARFEWSTEAEIRLQHADLASTEFKPATADVYFLYDFGTMKAIEKCLHDLRRIAKLKQIVIIARGQRCRSVIRSHHPWLSPDPRPSFSEKAAIFRSLAPVIALRHGPRASFSSSANTASSGP